MVTCKGLGKVVSTNALCSVPPVATMDEGAQATEKADGRTAGDRAGEALAKLEALLRKKNGICGMCRGEGEEPFPWPKDLSDMLQQLMQALIPRFGKGGGDKPGGGTGGSDGFGGLSDSGFSMRGKMPQLPIFGPSRQRFARQGGAQIGGKSGAGKGRGESQANVGSTPLATKPTEKATNEAPVAETVPEAYREAVKRYFSSDPPPAGTR